MTWDVKVIIGMMASMFIGMFVLVANTEMPKHDDEADGLRFACETYGGVYVDKKHCYKAENLFKQTKK